jgi:hypothetical protein
VLLFGAEDPLFPAETITIPHPAMKPEVSADPPLSLRGRRVKLAGILE